MWQEKLIKNGYVQIPHFLPEKLANQYRVDVLKASHYKSWDMLTAPTGSFSKLKSTIYSSITNNVRHKQAKQAYKRRQFSFSFLSFE